MPHGMERLWEAPCVPSSMEKIGTTQLSRDADKQGRPKELQLHSTDVTGPLVAMKSHEEEATASREMQVGSG